MSYYCKIWTNKPCNSCGYCTPEVDELIDMDYKDVIDEIKAAMKRKKMTIKKLAIYSGISENTIGRCLRGESKMGIGFENLLLILQALGLKFTVFK